MALAPAASVTLLGHVIVADVTPRIQLAALPMTLTATGDGWGEYRLAEEMRAAEQLRKPVIVLTTGRLSAST